MTKDKDIQKILVIGSGPIVIGQGAEFDYAGTQACLALREEGYSVVLCNSNPATIMTDEKIADKVYMEPLTVDAIVEIIEKERPDALLPSLGGQTGLNLAMALEEKGVLAQYGIRLLGTSAESIRRAEDRELFKELCLSINEPVIASDIAHSVEEGLAIAERISYPVVLRPGFTLGGTGGGFASDEKSCRELLAQALSISPVHQVLVEKSVAGYKEIEYEVMRDSRGTAIAICNMENMDPVGIHTGDSIVFAPSQTLDDAMYQKLRTSALKLISALEIEGGCNVQFAVHPDTEAYYIIEVNPRVSRSSALASKASGYPIAAVSAKIALGMPLEEIELANTMAAFEPTFDYVVCKMPRFPFDKFTDMNHQLGTQMKATGEVMTVGRNMEEALLKAFQSLEIGAYHMELPQIHLLEKENLIELAQENTHERVFVVAELLRRHIAEEEWTSMPYDRFFLSKLKNIIGIEQELVAHRNEISYLRYAKVKGFSDRKIAQLWKMTEEEIYNLRQQAEISPVYKMIDSCAAEFDAYVPYFYSTYEEENEAKISDGEKIIILGSGPIRIGQGVEFDYSMVHAIQTIRQLGYEAIVINNNPETVSTDYTMADALYFEPLTVEHTMAIIEKVQPKGVIVAFGGQTAINLAEKIANRGVPILGSSVKTIALAEHRGLFEALLRENAIPKPEGRATSTAEEAFGIADEIAYPLLVRPSFVLGGRAMAIINNREELIQYIEENPEFTAEQPLLLDRYIKGREVEVDAVCDGKSVFIPGIMELVDRAGIHSGDSISIYPSFSLSDEVKKQIIAYTERLGLAMGIIGLYNIQFIVTENEEIYCIEVNPRSSRTVPFISKATKIPLADIATKVMLGISLQEQDIHCVYAAEIEIFAVKVPVFSFEKLDGLDPMLSPEMKSTGEVIGFGKTVEEALRKGFIAANIPLHREGKIYLYCEEKDSVELLPTMKRLIEKGFSIVMTEECANTLAVMDIVREEPSTVLASVEKNEFAYIVSLADGNPCEKEIRREAIYRGIPVISSVDMVKILAALL